MLVHLCASDPILQRPHTLRRKLSCVSTVWWIVSHCRHCVVLLTEWCCFKLCPVPCWLRPGHTVVSACVVLFQTQCEVVEGIVRSPPRYCPGLMYVCLFMLQASLSGRWQFRAMGPLRSHSRSPLTSALWPGWGVSVCGRDTEEESVCLSVCVTDTHMCENCRSGFASQCLLRAGKHTPSHGLP